MPQITQAQLIQALTLAGVRVNLTAFPTNDSANVLGVKLYAKDNLTSMVTEVGGTTIGVVDALFTNPQGSQGQPLTQDPNFNLRVAVVAGAGSTQEVDPRDVLDRAAREVGRVRTWGNALNTGSGELTAPAANSLIFDLAGLAAGDYDVFWDCVAADTSAVGKKILIVHANSANAVINRIGGCAAPGQDNGFLNRLTLAVNDKFRAITGAAGAASSTYAAFIGFRTAG